MAKATKEWKKEKTKTKGKQDIIKMNKGTEDKMSKLYAIMST